MGKIKKIVGRVAGNRGEGLPIVRSHIRANMRHQANTVCPRRQGRIGSSRFQEIAQQGQVVIR
jgi:hypothetical protein